MHGSLGRRIRMGPPESRIGTLSRVPRIARGIRMSNERSTCRDWRSREWIAMCPPHSRSYRPIAFGRFDPKQGFNEWPRAPHLEDASM
jgi:hypothetical protein